MDSNHRISSSYIEVQAHNSHRSVIVTLYHLNGILFSVEAYCDTCHYCMVCHCSFLNDQGFGEVNAFSLVMISWEGEESTFSKEISSPNSCEIAWKEEIPSREELVLV